MKAKRGITISLIIFMFLFSIALVLADNHTESDSEDEIEIISTGFGEEIDKAYSCLKTQLGTDCADTPSTEQNVFSLLAMGYDSSIQSDCKDELEGKQGSDDCWGKTGSDSCNIKSTAQGILALDYVGENVDDELDWLLDKRELVDDLNWYLEIDANEATSCKIKVNGGSEKTFNIAENKRFSGSSSCLSPAESSYYLRIDNDCLGDNFTISCNKDFISTIWYKKPGVSTMYISSETHSAPAEGQTEEKVNAYCFTTSSGCDYQGSLWASLALARLGEDIYSYIPYITAMSDETTNKKYLPSAFLYMLTNEDDYYSELVDEQKQDKYWEETTNQKFYDTALALLSLQNVNIEQVDNTKEWLLEIQENSGCWHANNILETAFLLYAGWPKDPVFSVGTPDSRSYCSDFNYFCTSAGECTLGDTLSNYYCSGLSEVCCETEPAEQTCSEKDGIICDSSQRCTGSEVTAQDTNYCCLNSCEVISENECVQAGYFCRDFCSDSQEEKTSYSADCSFGETCCGSAPEKKSRWLLIILLIILIILVVLAIIFREQLKIWFFRVKSKFKFGKGSKPTARPRMTPPGPGIIPTLRPRHIIPRQRTPTRRPMRRVQRRTPAQKDSAFDDTMKKLRDMSK